MFGSSPRPWGTPDLDHRRRLRVRFIPTPVGNACRSRIQSRRRTVHPHARGERLGAMPSFAPGVRFIPTPVGNAPHASGRSAAGSVHSHARGERNMELTGRHWWHGSSPRPWGTPTALRQRWPGTRFIPTPVGNARRVAASSGRGTDHPHARGERVLRRRGKRHDYGSSPRPSGTPGAGRALSRGGRFIPTPVGNASRATWSARPRSVHPHARGERTRPWPRSTGTGGSSPRPWGTRRGHGRRLCPARFIPTPVGNAST